MENALNDTLITNVTIFDGSGDEPYVATVVIRRGLVHSISRNATTTSSPTTAAEETVDGRGLALAPGFIDTHTHDDLRLIAEPELICKLSQGVTSVIAGNCGISAAPVDLRREIVEPMNLLGGREEFAYESFVDFREAIVRARTAVNVAVLVGHTSVRHKFMGGSFDRAATDEELKRMREELGNSLRDGAIGLSTGLAYSAAKRAPPDEIRSLVTELATFPNTVYSTHMRTESTNIREAMDEAFAAVHETPVQLVVSHLKCYEKSNWGRSEEVLAAFAEAARENPRLAYDCYPYSACSTVIDLDQITDDYPIMIAWSTPHPEMTGRVLAEIASEWNVPLLEAARRLQPGGAIYHAMYEEDVRRIVAHPLSMIGSDGLPNDRFPHPRLYGTFPRVLARYARETGSLTMAEAIRKITRLPAERFRLERRGRIVEGYWADLVLFDPMRVRDRASFEDPIRKAQGIERVWVNGVLSYRSDQSGDDGKCVGRAGMFLARVES